MLNLNISSCYYLFAEGLMRENNEKFQDKERNTA